MARRLNELLAACSVAKGVEAPLTHTSFGGQPHGGRFVVSSTVLDDFMDAYAACIDNHHGGAAATLPSLVERHRHVGPVVVDIDLRQAGQERLYGPQHVSALVAALCSELGRLVVHAAAAAAAAAAAECPVYVLEKPSPRPCKAQFKDGLHLVLPGVVTRPELQFALREAMLPHVAAVFGPLGYTNKADDIYDKAVIQAAGWMMYGSKKPDEQHPWRVTMVLGADGAPLWDAGWPTAGPWGELPTPGQLVRLLSIRRYDVDEAPLTEAGEAAVQAMLDAAAARAEAMAAAAAAAASEGGCNTKDGSDMDEATLAGLVALLAPERATPREAWYMVGQILHRLDGCCPKAARLAMWKRFGATCPLRAARYLEEPGGDVERRADEAAHDAEWPKITLPANGGRPLCVGTMCMWAREDSPEGYRRWRAARRTLAAARSSTASEPVFGAPLAEAEVEADWDTSPVRGVASRVFKVPAELITDERIAGNVVRMKVDGTERVLDLQNYRIGPGTHFWYEAPPGLDCGSVVIPNTLAPIHGWNATRPSLREVHLHNSGTPRTLVVLAMDKTGEEVVRVNVAYPDSNRPAITLRGSKQLFAMFKEVLRQALMNDQRDVLRLPERTINVVFNNGTINNHTTVHAEQPSEPPRADDELADAWTKVYRAASTDERGMYRVVKSADKTYHYFEPTTGLWVTTSSMDMVCNVTLAAMKAVSGGAYFASLTDIERRYVGSMHGGQAVFRRGLNAVYDPRFEERLDANMRLLSFDNGVYDLDSRSFRPLRWDDYITRTIGYSYESEVDSEQMEQVHRFLRQVLPVDEERELVLLMAGSALAGEPVNKKFLVLQDARGGDNGKTVMLELTKATLGNYAMPTQSAFLSPSTRADANAHQGNMLSYKGYRLAVFDEADSSTRLDIAKIKGLTGGPTSRAVRGVGKEAVTQFRWSSFIIIACNAGCLPQMDSSDTAFVERLVTVPMRSKFNDALAAAGVPLSFPKDIGITAKLAAARMACMHVLLEAHARYEAAGRSFGQLPRGCVDLRATVVADSDPKRVLVEQVVERFVDFNPVRSDATRGRKVLGYVERDRLLDAVHSADKGGATLRGVKVAVLKGVLDNVMKERGRPLSAHTTIAGCQVYNVYKECCFRGPQQGEA